MLEGNPLVHVKFVSYMCSYFSQPSPAAVLMHVWDAAGHPNHPGRWRELHVRAVLQPVSPRGDRENVNATSMLLFLHKLKEVFVHYFNELEEESLRDNFVIAYELLDEVLLRLPCTCLGLSACLVQSLMLQTLTRAALTWQRGGQCMRQDDQLLCCHSLP